MKAGSLSIMRMYSQGCSVESRVNEPFEEVVTAIPVLYSSLVFDMFTQTFQAFEQSKNFICN